MNGCGARGGHESRASAGPVTEDHLSSKQSAVIRHQSRYNIPGSAQGVISFQRRLNPMSMKTKAAIVVSSAAVLLFMYVGGLDGVRASNNDGSYRQLQVYSEVLSRVRSEYVEEPNIPAGDRRSAARPAGVAGPQLQLSDRCRVQGVQGQPDRGQRRDRSSRVQTLRLRRGHLGHTRRSSGQGRHTRQRYLRSH